VQEVLLVLQVLQADQEELVQVFQLLLGLMVNLVVHLDIMQVVEVEDKILYLEIQAEQAE
jgi:hypothetical protein